MGTARKQIPLSRSHPSLAKQANGWDASEVTSGSSKKLGWKCPKNPKHIWIATPANRTRSNSGCPYCGNRRILKGENDLKSTHPKLAMEAFGWDPTTVSAGSKKNLKWKCKKNSKHIWIARPANRNYNKTGCPFCFGLQVLKGDNDLASNYPKLSKEAYGWDPTKVFAGGAKNLKWRCSIDSRHIWIARVETRTVRGYGCPFCSGKKLAKNSNDLRTTHPAMAKEAFGWDPKTITASSTKKLKWKCSKNSKHIWETTPSARKSKGIGCPVCVGKAVLKGDNDLASKFPKIAKEAYGWNPEEFTASSGKKLTWKCSKNKKHIWITSPGSRTYGLQSKCPYCVNRKVLKGDNDLVTTHPKLAKEAYGWDPTTVTAGMDKLRLWKCKKNSKHIWKTRVSHRAMSDSGCPNCSVSGFHSDLPGYLYFLSHSKWKMFQIGITNFPKVRIAQHVSKGWKKIQVVGPLDGQETRNWEKAFLLMLREEGADLGNQKIAGKFDGYTEAWSKSRYAPKSIAELKRKSKKYLAN